MVHLRIIKDAMNGRIDDDYLNRLSDPNDYRFAFEMRKLYQTVFDQILSVVKESYGTNQTDARSAENVLPPGNGDG